MPWPEFDFPSDAAWDELPGGRAARNGATGDAWRLLATNTATDPCRHLFVHPAHPDFQGECAVAHVDDRGDAAELAIFAVLVPGVDVDDLDLEVLKET
jgi:hypothetical protein